MPKKKTNVTVNFQNASGPLSIRMTNDYIFKVLMQKNPLVLKSLISSLLHLPPESITDIKILNPIILGEDISDKIIILDVFVELNNHERIDLEMQIANEKNWVDRSTYYLCRNFVDLENGSSYKESKPMYQIGFLDFTLFDKTPAFYSTYKLCNVKTNHIYNNKLSISVVDMSRIDLATKEDRKYNIDKWAKLFKAETWEDIKMLTAQNIAINEAADTIYQMSEDERIRRQYEAREDYLRRQKGMADDLAEAKEELAEKDKALANSKKIIEEQAEQIAKLEAQLAAQNK